MKIDINHFVKWLFLFLIPALIPALTPKKAWPTGGPITGNWSTRNWPMLDQLRLVLPGIDRSATVLRVASDYLALTKPPIVLLLLITAIGGMFLAARGGHSLSIIL